jgi:hypothetical protein
MYKDLCITRMFYVAYIFVDFFFLVVEVVLETELRTSCLRYAPSSFCYSYFRDRVSLLPRQNPTMAGLTGMHQHAPLRWDLTNYFPQLAWNFNPPHFSLPHS